MLPALSPLVLASEAPSTWGIISGADPIVKLVMVVLAVFSLVSWAIIIQRFVILKRAAAQSVAFLDRFWSTTSLEEAYGEVGNYPESPIASAFSAGYKELKRLGQVEEQVGTGPLGGGVDNVGRALRKGSSEALTRLEQYIPFLASCGSAAPFIGLFGTVWGIMVSFVKISQEKAAGIDVVAGPIAEALIVTAVGLVTAIPAGVAYNLFLSRIRVLASEMENFSNDLGSCPLPTSGYLVSLL